MSSAMSKSHLARPAVIRLSILFAVLAAGFLAAVGVDPRPARADTAPVFNVTCPLTHSKSDDPIVFPGLPGASHRHAFYGNVSTDAASTTKSLAGAKSSCQRGFDTSDRSAYWVPSLYRVMPGGEKQEVVLDADHQYLTAYYRRAGGTDGEKVKPFPQGLRMLGGDPTSVDKPQSTNVVSWRCNGNTAPESSNIPNCGSGTKLQAILSFPDCWDGVNLDSPNHRTHMAHSSGEQGTCPATHPVKLPELTFEITFNLNAVSGASYELSSGGQYSSHGDFFAAWDDKVQSALVNQCLNAGKYCENIERSKVDLSQAGPATKGTEPGAVKAAAAGSGSPSVSVSGSKPVTGAGGLGEADQPGGDGGVEGANVNAAADTNINQASSTSSLGSGGIVAAIAGAVLIGAVLLFTLRRRRLATGPGAHE